ncbi:MAG: DUF5709 domain-containing protein [Acidimicrobiales bacterium]
MSESAGEPDSDQLQPDDTLEDRGVEDYLDEGVSPPEKLRGSEAKSTTAEGELEGESIDERMLQEEPDPAAQVAYGETSEDRLEVDPAEDVVEDGEVGDERSGRLVAPDEGRGEDDEAGMIGEDVGIDGAGAGAEEAAVHTVSPDEGEAPA